MKLNTVLIAVPIAILLATSGAGAAPAVLYDTGWEASPASPAWVSGNVSGQNGWSADGADPARHRVVDNGSVDANPFGTAVTTPYGSRFHRFTASNSTTTNNGQYAWPDLSGAFAGRPVGYNRLTGSLDMFVPSGASLDDSAYGLFGFDSSPDGNFLDFGFLINPNTRAVVIVIDGAPYATANGVFPYDTWFNVAIQVNYETGGLSVLYNGTPVPALAGTNPFIVGSTFTDLDLFCQNSQTAPNPRVVFSDNYRVVVEPLVAGNSAPTLAPIGNFVVNVLNRVSVTNRATDVDVPANVLTYSLAPGFPAGARVGPTNGIFRWVPTREQAASTNTITVTVTDNGAPPLSDSKSFQVIVNDLVEWTLGSTILQAGQTGSIPVTVFSTAPITNTTAVVDFPTGRFSDWTLEPVAPFIGSMQVQLAQSRLLLSFSASQGQSITGTQLLAQLKFVGDTLPPSAFLPLHLSGVTGLRPDGSAIPAMLANDGRVALVVDKPLVEALAPAGSQRLLILYGKPGTNYTIQTSSALSSSTVWSTFRNTTLTGQSETNGGLGSAGLIYYRARE